MTGRPKLSRSLLADRVYVLVHTYMCIDVQAPSNLSSSNATNKEAGKIVLVKNPRKTATSHKFMRRLKDIDRIPDCSIRPTSHFEIFGDAGKVVDGRRGSNYFPR
jgi:hypothetical protein